MSDGVLNESLSSNENSWNVQKEYDCGINKPLEVIKLYW